MTKTTPPTDETIMTVSRSAESAVAELSRINVIATDAQYEDAAEIMKSGKAIIKEIGDTLDPLVKSTHAAHKAATDLRARILNPVKRACDRTRKMMDDYMTAKREAEEKRIAQEQARLAAEAAQRAKEEADKLAQQAEVSRKKAEAARAAGDEVLASAHEGTADRRKTAAQHVAENYIVPAAKIAPELPKVDGIATRTEWYGEVIDRNAIPPEYFMLDTQRIDAIVRAKKNEHGIPGIAAKSRQKSIVRG